MPPAFLFFGLEDVLVRLDQPWSGRPSAAWNDATVPAGRPGETIRLNVPILPVVAALCRTGVPLGILAASQGPDRHDIEAWGYAALTRSFREVVLSADAAEQPHRGIYELAAVRAGVPPERIFFCDRLPAHVDAALRLGWDAEVFHSAHVLAEQLARRGLNLGL